MIKQDVSSLQAIVDLRPYPSDSLIVLHIDSATCTDIALRHIKESSDSLVCISIEVPH